MLITDIKRVIEQVSRDKGIDSNLLVRALEEALKSAARKRFGSKIDIEVKYNESLGEIEVFQFKEVVDTITEPETQIQLEEGLELDPDCEIGDCIGTKMDTASFGRIAAQSAKQVIIQKMKDAEREAIYTSFIHRKGEIINGIVQRFERNNIIVNLGQAEAMLPNREQIPRETYRRGDRIRAYIMDVRNEGHGPQIVLSRTHPDFLISLFKTEVPEISEGLVSVMGVAREPGSRGKIAVVSNDMDVDPVGACVGMKGSRVQNVVQELKGEKIDIIPWHVDPAKYVCNALAPAEISRVIIDEGNRSMEVIVPDENLSKAIGVKGLNVRLASKLTKWRLDVISETKYSANMKNGYESLMALPGVGISLADALYEKGFFSAEELGNASVDDLLQVRNMTQETAENLIRVSINFLEEAASGHPLPTGAPDEEDDAVLPPCPEADEAPEPDTSGAGLPDSQAHEDETPEPDTSGANLPDSQAHEDEAPDEPNTSDADLPESQAREDENEAN